jgi:hypothetical protein
MSANPGLDVPIPKCRGCTRMMEAFDALPRRLRGYFNDEVAIRWCMCGALESYRTRGEAQTLERYRKLERRYRDDQG